MQAIARLFSPEAVAARTAQPKDTAFVPGEADNPPGAAPSGQRRGDRHSPGGALGGPQPCRRRLPACRPAQLTAEAQATYQRAIAAQRAGDWATYGAEITRLGQILERLAQPR